MRVGEAPATVDALALMQRLEAYANGTAHWEPDSTVPAERDRNACRELHSSLCKLARSAFEPLLTRTTAREMEAFTAHDPTHARKVAHLMWLILPEQRRGRLTPAEIGLMVGGAYLHDMGMGAGDEDRRAMLADDSDLWEILDIDASLRKRITCARADLAALTGKTSPDYSRKLREAAQAEEALLCRYLRENHATRQRYDDLLAQISAAHGTDPVGVPDPLAGLCFDGDSFIEMLIEICVSHGESAWELIRRDGRRDRFPTRYPVGGCHADTRMIAAALRLADVLDFDRERTPAMLYHYLLPTPLAEDRAYSKLEWSKHMAIANWSIDGDAVRYSARCPDHVVHHAVRQFCDTIQTEIATTREALSSINADWPFALPSSVVCEIFDDGTTRFQPFRFELDDDRIYRLLMGSQIYDTPLAAVRELVQNAVDACLLRDRLTQMTDPTVNPATEKRITVRYLQPDADHTQARLVVKDSGTGMDLATIQQYFLKVGRSYYSSSEFNALRAKLRRTDDTLDFAPTSEFGIGFLSCFLLADRVQVETAHWKSPRGDHVKRTLVIDGPTKLMAMGDEVNEGLRPFAGTRVTLTLTKGGENGSPTGAEIFRYLDGVCQDLPYPITCEIEQPGNRFDHTITPKGIAVAIPDYLEPAAIRIPLAAPELGLDGEIVLFDRVAVSDIREANKTVRQQPITEALTVVEETMKVSRKLPSDNVVIRNGFRVSRVSIDEMPCVRVRLRRPLRDRSLAFRTSVARTGIENGDHLAHVITRLWLTHCLENPDLPANVIGALPGMPYDFDLGSVQQRFSAGDVYRLLRPYWQERLGAAALTAWEEGRESAFLQNIDTSETFNKLLRAILSQISHREYDPKRQSFVSPPPANWRDQLDRCHTWAGNTFGRAHFVGKITDWLFLGRISSNPRSTLTSGLFNGAFDAKLPTGEVDQLDILARAINRLISGRHHGSKAELSRTQFDILQANLPALGDHLVGGTYTRPKNEVLTSTDEKTTLVGPWPLRDFLTEATPE